MSGKFYWEAIAGGSDLMFGIYNPAQNTSAANPFTHTGGAIAYFGSNGTKYINGANTAYGATYTTNDIIGVAVDIDASTVTFYKNNASQGAISLPANMIGVPISASFLGASSQSSQANFGQRSFAYIPPTGFKALCTANLPAATIVKGNQYMDATTYTGNGSTQNVTNAGGFSPDLVWGKRRDSAGNHNLYDKLRGVTNYLSSNGTGAEISGVTGVTAFNANGFSIGSHPDMNASAGAYVAWQWKEGATQGIDVITYSGNGSTQNVSHSLGIAPSMIIVKSRNNVQNWLVYHKAIGAGQYLLLHATSAATSSTTPWNNTAPTSSVFSVGADNGTNGTGYTYVAYCFAEIAGFSKFGSYTGNGSTDGPFVYTGFRPRFIIYKNSSATSSWVIFDSSRNSYNVCNSYLLPDSAAVEGTSAVIDFLSNGFKLRAADSANNGNGNTIIYACFAENPFAQANAR